MKDTEREAEREAEGEAGSTQEAQRQTRSQVSRITPQAVGGTKPLSHWGCPKPKVFKDLFEPLPGMYGHFLIFSVYAVVFKCLPFNAWLSKGEK